MASQKTLKKIQLRNNEYYNMQDKFDELYEKSGRGYIFKDLYSKIVDEDNIKLAYRNLKTNTGSTTPGVDGKTIKDISEKKLGEYVAYILRKFKNYTPKEVRRVLIPKADGKLRPLGIPCIDDRIIQQAIKQILEPILENKFYEQSYGFRPNRSTEHAIAKAMTYMNKYKLHYVVDIDIKGFFDNVNHGKLLKQLWNLGIRDKKVISIISKILKSPIHGEGVPTKGTPQGGIISPLLSNVVLNELDWWIDSQWNGFKTRHKYAVNSVSKGENGTKFRALRSASNLKEMQIVRYADDFKIFCRDSKTAFKIYNAVVKWLRDRLGLEVSPEKSKVTNLRKNYTEFLGFKLKLIEKSKKYVCYSRMSDKSVEKVKRTLRNSVKELQRKNNKGSVCKLNSRILGIHNYYMIATGVNIDFHDIGYSIERLIDKRLGKHLSNKLKPDKTYMQYYGKYKYKPRTLHGITIYPIKGIKTRNAMQHKKKVNEYTVEGRALIHNNLCFNDLLNRVRYDRKDSTELCDNKISLLIAQNGKCGITKRELEPYDMECHHKKPRYLGGNDKYQNLIWLCKDVHTLIHSTVEGTITRLLENLRLDKVEIKKVNILRELVGNSLI